MAEFLINIGEHGYLHEAGGVGQRNEFHGSGRGWMDSVGYNHPCHFKFLMEVLFFGPAKPQTR